MKKLLVIAILMLALVFTVVACNNDPVTEETTLGDTTVETPTEAPTAEPEDPTEPEETTEEPEETTEEPEETTEEPEVTTEEETTEEVTTADPADPVWMMDAEALAAMANTATSTVEKTEDGFASFTAVGADPWFLLTGNIGEMPKYMAIRYRTNTDKNGEFFISNGANPEGGKSFVFSYTADSEWNLLIFDLSVVAPYMTEATVGHIRYDFFVDIPAEGTFLEVEYIAFFNTAEYATAYDFEMHKAPMWDADKAVISHQSFDELDKYANGAKIEGVFAPGQSVGWDKVLTLNDFSVEALRYWGWIAGVTEQGVFGYQINGGAAIYDEAWTQPEDLMAHAPAGSTYTTRMKIMISLEGLVGENTIRALYKDAAGTEVCLNEFTVVLPARAPFEVPEHTDETIVLGTRVNGGPFSNTKNFGQRFTVAEGFLKNITITNMATYADGNANKWNVTIWAWNTDYATTISGEPLYTVNGENHNDNQHFVLDVPADLGIMGDIYYEITYLEGSAQFTGWAADGGAAEGVEAYIAGNLAEGTYASSIIVGIPTVEDPDAPVEPDEPAGPTLTLFTGKYHANVDHINGAGPAGAPNYSGLGSSVLNSNGSIPVRKAADDGIVVSENGTVVIGGWMAVAGGINHYAYTINGGELIVAAGGIDGEPLDGYFAQLGMTEEGSTKNGRFPGADGVVADLSAYAGQTVTVTFYAIPEAAQETVAPIVTIEGLVVPGSAPEA